MKKLFILLLLIVFSSGVVIKEVNAKGGGGGRSSGGSRSSSTARSSPSKSTSSTSSSSKSSTPSKPSTSTKPSSSTKTTTAPSAKKVNGTTFLKKGNVVDSNYKPRFNGGYTPPDGSTVYYRDNSFMNWLPFYLIMTNQSHREAVVVEPGKDGQPGKESVVKEEGTDGMYIWNWIFSILIIIGLIALVVWLVNRRSSRYA